MRARLHGFFIPLTILLSVALSSPSSSAEVRNVVIGYQGPLSGEESPIGLSQLDAVKFVLHHFNESFRGILNVTLVTADDQGDPAQAAKVAPTVATNSAIIGLIGPAYSGATIASLPSYKQHNLPMISPSATRVSITDPAAGNIGFPVFHRVPPTDKVQGPSLFKLATKGVSSPKVFVVDDQSAYGVGLVDYMKPAIPAGQSAGFDSVSGNTTDWSATISKIRTAGANVVIFTGFYPQAAVFFKQLRDSGYTGILAGGDGVPGSDLLTLAPASVLEGVRLTSGTVPLTYISTDLESNFKSVTGRASGAYAAETIDATNILLYCITDGSDTREQMLSCIKAFNGKSLTGASLSFDANGDVAGGAMNTFEIRSGTIRFFERLSQQDQTVNSYITNMPWSKGVAEAKAKAKAEAEAKAKAEAESKAALEACLALNKDLEEILISTKAAALVYQGSVKMFDDLYVKRPKALDCEVIDKVGLLSMQVHQRAQLEIYKFALEAAVSLARSQGREDSQTKVDTRAKVDAELKEKQEAEAAALAAAAKSRKTTITCVKGKLTKKITAVKPKCPKGYKKK